MSDGEQKKWIKPVLILGGVVAVVMLLQAFGVTDHFSRENIGALSAKVESLGVWGPAAFIVLDIAGCLFFLPGLALTLLAGVFGAVMGTAYVSIASTLGAALCQY